MEDELLQKIIASTGIGGLSLGVLLLVFLELIKKNIFPVLQNDHAYSIVKNILYLTWFVAVLGILAWVYIERLDRPDGKSVIIENKLEEYRNISRDMPWVGINYHSNFSKNAFYPIDVDSSIRAQGVKSILEIINESDRKLTSFSFSFYYSYDPSLHADHTKEIKAKLLTYTKLPNTYGVLKPRTSIEVDIFDALSKNENITPIILFPGNINGYLKGYDYYKRKQKQYNGAIGTNDSSSGTDLFPTINDYVWRALYFRGVIKYSDMGKKYTHIITGRIGIGADLSENGNKALFVSDSFHKQGNSIISFSDQTEYYPIDMPVNNKHLNSKVSDPIGGHIGHMDLKDTVNQHDTYIFWKNELINGSLYRKYIDEFNEINNLTKP